MYKMMVIYEEPKDKAMFDEHYLNIHVPLVKKLPNLLGFAVHRVTGTKRTDISAYLVVELQYADEEKFNESFVSEEGREAQEDTQKMLPYLHRLPSVWFVEEIK